MNSISVVLVDKGTSPYLFKSLHAVASFADEILIGDIGIDASVVQALKKDAQLKDKLSIISIRKDVPYVEIIRDELHQKAKGTHVLVLDPDEIMPSPLLHMLRLHMDKYDVIKIPRQNIIFEKWISHSRWWPDYQVRFFKKGAVKWPKKIHTQPKISGNVFELPAQEEYAIKHYNYRDLDEYALKAPRYAKAQAKEDVAQNEPHSFAHYAQLALSEFIGRYFADDGYKDGMHGFVLAWLQMMYYFLVYFYVWEEKKYQEESQASMVQQAVRFFANALFEVSHWGKQKKLLSLSWVRSKLHSVIRT